MRAHCETAGGPVESGATRSGDVRIAYEDFGKPGGRAGGRCC
jgi:hypothetical protein